MLLNLVFTGRLPWEAAAIRSYKALLPLHVSRLVTIILC
jgi:hypothetical protein